ncbi:hypothetical protein BH11BAC7_BH11BAC7_21210 [soil metagenome]
MCIISGLTINYHFPITNKLYDTNEKRIAFLKKEGNIVTFKKPVKWKEREFSQILISRLEESKAGVKVIGMYRDSPLYKRIDQLLKAIDWELMERWHSD